MFQCKKIRKIRRVKNVKDRRERPECGGSIGVEEVGGNGGHWSDR